MKKWFLHILLLAGLFGVLTTSCSQEEGLELSDEKVQISFTLAMDGAPLSRATWDSYSPSETGAGIDNIIKRCARSVNCDAHFLLDFRIRSCIRNQSFQFCLGAAVSQF